MPSHLIFRSKQYDFVDSLLPVDRRRIALVRKPFRHHMMNRGKIMKQDELKALEAAAVFYQAVPDYLLGKTDTSTLELALIEVIDALDIVEYRRTCKSFLQSIQYEIPYQRKRSLLSIAKEYKLTPQEGHILRYLANGRDSVYIANRLTLSINTVKTHKYAIYRKLGVHNKRELEELLKAQDRKEFEASK